MPLYYAFVDFQKAFDTVWRQALWLKLIKHGVEGKVFRIIHNMYESIKSCVHNEGNSSAFFSSKTGVRQGGKLSPLLFSIYLNDVEQYLTENGCTNIDFGRDEQLCTMLKLFVLLYADDMVLIADSPAKLQSSLDVLESYCDLWKLKVNVDKTKVVIFRKRKTKNQPIFRYKGKELEITKDFKYLGVTLSSTGSFAAHKKNVCEQATKAMYAVLRRGRALHLPLDIMFNLFDTMVSPILLNACEVWGTDNLDIIERVHLKLCKHVLRLKPSTPNYMVYGETGRFPLEITVKIRMLSYWCKLVSGQCSKLASKMYGVLVERHRNNSLNITWITFMEQLFNDTGFSETFRNHEFSSDDWIKAAMSLRLRDQYIQKWNQTVQTSPKATLYRVYKETWGFEQYLLELPTVLRISMCKYRTSNHRLAIEKLRYINVPREHRTCHMCNSNQLGDEFHFLLICQKLSRIRSQYLPMYYITRPNVIKFQQIMTKPDKKTLLNLAKFIKIGLQQT